MDDLFLFSAKKYFVLGMMELNIQTRIRQITILYSTADADILMLQPTNVAN